MIEENHNKSYSFFCPPAAGCAWRRMRRPPGSWTGLASLGNTVGMLEHVFAHQAPLTRPLEAVVAACSATKRRWVQGDEHSPWVAEMSPNHGFSRISEKSRFSSKNKSRQMDSKSILSYPGHAYAPGNDFPTPWGCHTPVSRLVRRWAGTHSTVLYINFH